MKVMRVVQTHRGVEVDKPGLGAVNDTRGEVIWPQHSDPTLCAVTGKSSNIHRSLPTYYVTNRVCYVTRTVWLPGAPSLLNQAVEVLGNLLERASRYLSNLQYQISVSIG